MKLPVIRSSERADFKRCQRKWFWKWRKGYVPRAKTFGALDLGTWFHSALQAWYGSGTKRNGSLAALLVGFADAALTLGARQGAPEHQLENASELAALGEAMAEAYERHYGKDPKIDVIGAEIPLEFTLSGDDGKVIAIHRLTPDMVYMDPAGGIWLMEHKTAKQIITEHLVIDDQARPYGAMAELALKKDGWLHKQDNFRGIMYNFIRKQLPDERPVNSKGQALNKDGTVSKKQPAPLFLRYPLPMTRPAKVRALQSIRRDMMLITLVTQNIRDRTIDPDHLSFTPHKSCPRFCDFFAMCSAKEQGADTREMERTMFTRQDPYARPDTTDEPATFEIG